MRKPTKEEFERASNILQESQQGLNEVSNKILNKFKQDGIHKIYISFSPTYNLFICYIFYKKNNLIDNIDLSSKIKEAIYKQLESIGKGERERIRINFKLDSHENIIRDYNGNYQNYLNRFPSKIQKSQKITGVRLD